MRFYLLLRDAYATVNVRTGSPEQHPVAPIAAIQTTQAGSLVLTVGPDNKVEQRQVTLGKQSGQDYLVQQGLSGGKRVVIAGIQKVHPILIASNASPLWEFCLFSSC